MRSIELQFLQDPSSPVPKRRVGSARDPRGGRAPTRRPRKSMETCGHEDAEGARGTKGGCICRRAAATELGTRGGIITRHYRVTRSNGRRYKLQRDGQPARAPRCPLLTESGPGLSQLRPGRRIVIGIIRVQASTNRCYVFTRKNPSVVPLQHSRLTLAIC